MPPMGNPGSATAQAEPEHSFRSVCSMPVPFSHLQGLCTLKIN